MVLSLLYTIGIYIANFHLKVIALFNHKIKLGVKGRAKTFDVLKNKLKKNDKVLWFHCASLGEYEQGLPVFEALRKQCKNHKIVITFFSPSGYEIRKNSKIADAVVYLPLDTKRNAKRFLDLVHPEYIIFVKYEIWPNFLNEIRKRQINAILISAVFRKNQSFFKFYGSRMQKALRAFQHIFVQDDNSKTLLNSIDFSNVTKAGDTRFDRVFSQLQEDNNLDYISSFKQDKLCVVIGSSWPEDEELLVQFINTYSKNDIKYIIAPHNIKSSQIENLVSNIKQKVLLFSKKQHENIEDFSVFIIDTIGLLTKIYSYADIAYVGGAMGKTGLHNILEPATFGVPIVIGENYNKFPEAYKMIEKGGLVSINNYNTLEEILDLYIKNKTKRIEIGELNKEFVINNKGAVNQIIDFITQSLTH